LVEDNPDSRELLVDSVQRCRRLELLAVCGSGEEALKELPKVKPDVVLMDIRLPGMSGIECLEALRHLSPPCDCPVLMLTEYGAGELIFDALQAGADGYLLKRDAGGKELEAAIVEVMAGGGPMSPSVAHLVIASFHPSQGADCRSHDAHSAAVMALSAREQDVLMFAARGLAYKEISGHLGISLNTVRKHIRSICYKLHVQSRCDPRLYSVSQQYLDRPRH
jgi:DNA-binding NarL/FixJ family response regulator